MKDETPVTNSVEVAKRVGYAIVGENNDFIGDGQRGQMYIFWDEDDAQEVVDSFNRVLKLAKTLDWKVIPCSIEARSTTEPTLPESGKGD